MDYFEHTFRSYYGFISILLIKTADNKVYIIDAIKLRSSLIELVRITNNPLIMKIIPSEKFEVTHM